MELLSSLVNFGSIVLHNRTFKTKFINKTNNNPPKYKAPDRGITSEGKSKGSANLTP
jgi:hypothetical protein